jgi:hypothetical protein
MQFDSRYRKFGLIVSDEYDDIVETKGGITKHTNKFSVIGFKVLNLETLSFSDVYTDDENIEFESCKSNSHLDSLIIEEVISKTTKITSFYLVSVDKYESVTSFLPVYKRNGVLYKSYMSNKVLYNLCSVYSLVVDAKSLTIDITSKLESPEKYDRMSKEFRANYLGGEYIDICDKNALTYRISDSIYGNADFCYIDNKNSREIVIPSSCKYIQVHTIGVADTIVFGKCAEVIDCWSQKLVLLNVNNIYISKEASTEFVGSYLYFLVVAFCITSDVTDLIIKLRHDVEMARKIGYAKVYAILSKEEYKDTMEYILDRKNIVIY